MTEPSHAADLAILNHRLEALHADLSDVKAAMRDVASALVKLTLLEERQAQSSEALQRAFGVLERVEGRLATLEAAQPIGSLVHKWVIGAAGGAATLLVMAVAHKAGIV